MVKSRSEEKIRFGVLDIVRILGGILAFNALLSWWFTSTGTWGYRGRWIDPRYVKFKFSPGYLNLTIAELALYNGSDPKLPIYVAINGSVYDVTKSPGIYGPGGSYHKVSGKDSARVFVTGCLMKEDEFTYDLRGLDQDEAAYDILQWQQYFHNSERYWYVGSVQHDPLTGDPPAPCDHIKYPGRSV
ncbi:cytochrome b5 [Suhomyces tanzawaensis NRRL Y-17324]|uniref:Cytochrome b5 n=1 Tax=Suhomyces tanzawaensis NRRL Y-17324 TaxID=984487 RepID=A0A1E4SMN8_9ASCO|nr:cytochrome b5 [Suhomyces tanzawaensis NRRL Y-17324]ODV80783.1 cytochrome b5 [Suhomyces tanzawaensis NRRL Y-17324]